MNDWHCPICDEVLREGDGHVHERRYYPYCAPTVRKRYGYAGWRYGLAAATGAQKRLLRAQKKARQGFPLPDPAELARARALRSDEVPGDLRGPLLTRRAPISVGSLLLIAWCFLNLGSVAEGNHISWVQTAFILLVAGFWGRDWLRRRKARRGQD